MLNPVVVINIFNDEGAAHSYDRPRSDDERQQAFSHWPARYVKNWTTRLNTLIIYPGCDHQRPEQVAF